MGDAVVAAHDARVARAARERRVQWMALAAAAVLLLALVGVWMLWPPSAPAPAPRSAAQRAEPSTPSGPSEGPAAPSGPSGPSGRSGSSGAHGPSGSPSPSVPSQLATLAVSISPLTVRGAAEAPPLVIPPGIAIVAARLEGDASAPRLTHARAVVRTVEGVEVWRGAASTGADLGAGLLARVDIPADRLRANDYIIILFAEDAAGVGQERYRYALRVRAR